MKELEYFWVSPDFQTYMRKQNILQHLEITRSWVSCNFKVICFVLFLFLSQIFFLTKDELDYGDTYTKLMAGICSSNCQNMIACFFDQDLVALLRSFKFCFLLKYEEL